MQIRERHYDPQPIASPPATPAATTALYAQADALLEAGDDVLDGPIDGTLSTDSQRALDDLVQEDGQ